MSKKVSYKRFNIESSPRLLQEESYSVNEWVWEPSASRLSELFNALKAGAGEGFSASLTLKPLCQTLYFICSIDKAD